MFPKDPEAKGLNLTQAKSSKIIMHKFYAMTEEPLKQFGTMGQIP